MNERSSVDMYRDSLLEIFNTFKVRKDNEYVVQMKDLENYITKMKSNSHIT